jgi:hypothetical protein
MQAAVDSNSARRSGIDRLDAECGAVRRALQEAAQLQSRLAASIDEGESETQTFSSDNSGC